MINKLKKIWKETFARAKKHKIVSAILILLILGGGYYWYSSVNKNTGQVSYVSSPAEKGTIVTSVSGSGQVSASQQIDIKSKVSENVIYIPVKPGQQVKAGTFLMQFDSANEQKAVRNAELSLKNAQLSFQKLAGAPGLTTPLNKQQAQDNLSQAYGDAFNAVSNTFLDLPNIMTGLQSALFNYDISANQQNIDYYKNSAELHNPTAPRYRADADNAYQKARAAYDKNFADYKLVTRTSDTSVIDSIISETYTTAQDVSDAIKSANNFIQFYKDNVSAMGLKTAPVADTQLTSLNTYAGKLDADLTNLLNAQSTIKNDKDAITTSDLDLQSQQLSVQQAQNSLQDAKDNLANCYIYAPFSGIVADIPVNRGDSVSSGSTVITFIANQSITGIPFNEVDITKIQVGQKATLTFDAIDGLTIAGQVAQIDTLGTVTQGVVNYNVKIVFDASGTQVKPGMSVTANVITNAKQNVITVANSAVKTSGNSKYVQILINGKPEQKIVTTGLSNDTDTEITSGLSGGENVITQTITSSAASTTSTAGAGTFGIPGIGGGTGGARINTGGGNFGR